MDAQPFIFPMRHLPFLGTEDWSAYPFPLLRFKQQGSDKGLANAVRFYWLAKRITLTVSMSVQDVQFVEVDPPTDPITYTSGTRTFEFSKTYTMYATDAEATALSPAASTAEEDWTLPHERGGPLEEFIYPLLHVPPVWMTFVPAADDVVTGSFSFTPLRIEFNAVQDRWCLAMDAMCAIVGYESTGDYGFAVDTSAYLQMHDYTLAGGEVEADFTYPDIFDDVISPKLVYAQPTHYDADVEAFVNSVTSVAFEFAVDYWAFPA